MAEVYRRAKGKKVEEVVALEAQDGLRMHVTAAAGKAASELASHRDSGKAQIVLERDPDRPKLDWLIVLDDEDDLFGAMTIEKGRKASTVTDKNGRRRDLGAMRPVAPLSKAVGLPVED